jgi:hypothetical protein
MMAEHYFFQSGLARFFTYGQTQKGKVMMPASTVDRRERRVGQLAWLQLGDMQKMVRRPSVELQGFVSARPFRLMDRTMGMRVSKSGRYLSISRVGVEYRDFCSYFPVLAGNHGFFA